ncbi:MAG: hypothetical protein KatS3mg068_1424 [Candidatus Sericytochromatia bacterium]|nr:MAG: hypothetical protein KatS3mg068_1424 [Candidatus Sericytochromatia bacterium]
MKNMNMGGLGGMNIQKNNERCSKNATNIT